MLTKEQWLAKATADAPKLRSFVNHYHPAMPPKIHKPMRITATVAEMACENVRGVIALRDADKPSPLQRFDAALLASDVDEIYSLLDAAWFGVPESTECWGIEGFSEAVDLMDDVPE